MNLAASGAHDVLNAESANQQGVGDERTMTAPWHSFRAHQDNSALVCEADQLFEALGKLRRLHVIRVTSKGGVSPPHVVGISLRTTQAAESRNVYVPQARVLQRLGQRILVELRVVPGTRHRPHVHDTSCPVRVKQADEFLERAGGVPDRHYQWRGVSLWHASFHGPGSVNFATHAQGRLLRLMTGDSVILSLNRVIVSRSHLRFHFGTARQSQPPALQGQRQRG